MQLSSVWTSINQEGSPRWGDSTKTLHTYTEEVILIIIDSRGLYSRGPLQSHTEERVMYCVCDVLWAHYTLHVVWWHVGGWRGETIAFPDPAQHSTASPGQGWIGQDAVVAGCAVKICTIALLWQHLTTWALVWSHPASTACQIQSRQICYGQ